MSAKKTAVPSIDGTPAAEILRRLEITVTRRLDGDVLVWNYLNGYVSRLVRLGPPESAPPR